MKNIVLKKSYIGLNGKTFERKIIVGCCYTDWNNLYATDFGFIAKRNRGRAAYDCWCADPEMCCGPEFCGKGKVLDHALTAAEKKEFEEKVLQDEFFSEGWSLAS